MKNMRQDIDEAKTASFKSGSRFVQEDADVIGGTLDILEEPSRLFKAVKELVGIHSTKKETIRDELGRNLTNATKTKKLYYLLEAAGAGMGAYKTRDVAIIAIAEQLSK